MEPKDAPMTNGPQQTPAGWYEDGQGSRRYWDGNAWTQHTQPANPIAAATSVAPDQRASQPLAFPVAGQHGRTRKPGMGTGAKIGLGIGGLLVVGISVAALNGGSDGSATTDVAGSGSSAASSPSGTKTSGVQTSSKPVVKPAGPGIGSKVKDGKFTFTVTKVVSGKKTIGDQYLNTKAQGQFVLVYITVVNHGTEPQSFFGDNQVVYDAEGRKFSADTEAAIYLGDKAQSLYEEINPGNSVKAIVVFDVQKNVKPVKIELHDSAFSGGVQVDLTQ